MADLRRAYGAAAWHLPLTVGCLAVAGWVALRLAGEPTAGRMLLWFVGAAVVHDLVLFPAYAAADRTLGRAGRSLRNHVRVPALGSALLFLVYLPGVLGLGDGTYAAATGLAPAPLLGRWLAVTGVLFAVSALLYTARRPWRR
ncbi:hypothetical protein O7598_12930 [Micromonospora sp. WMMC241]|uniref:hypothetical protein n=1 Tax=Micromonospora sp. WMMC241 TaxID=3015159 RepID=UPI0022B6F766|nr:hypothetical protein [Micromonospora sp. WMMC241]MCZ7437303.1 hypothetical protein [Micromonospora sp. WMMC241]